MRTLRASLVAVLFLAGITLALPGPGAFAADAGGPEDALHQVRPGDELHLLAGYYYGDARQWERIWRANRDQVSNPNRIRRGDLLRIPDATPPAESYADFFARTRRAEPIAASPARGEAAGEPAAAMPPPGQQPPSAGAPGPAGAADAPPPPPAKRP